ncbi:MAG: hypothetical protein CL920_23385 [Deltaproteobacteria bacterium]|nr:hypothetical protein [Deltaproteobacteria bacterium]MBU51644.1 hypothetical protein [Deltaproteobacteria bacterium]|tara:strand:- start:687 stop:2321 length:1635 start_codon:yes stop_codon:yes gene_type:complete
MQFDYRYLGNSSVQGGANETAMSFVPDASRPPTYFIGELHKKIAFREAISALHDVVISDMRYQPKDRSEYKEWAAQQEFLDWEGIALDRKGVKDQIDALSEELGELRRRSRQRRAAFEKAKQKYFNYLYKVNLDAWWVLDPVITVHPDEIFFECFSQDESSYGKLGCNYEVFGRIDEFSCGTTNIDYSQALYNEFQKIRTYKTTSLTVDPSGFDVKTQGEDDYREVKIDLPDTWVRGFLQVSSAMTLPARSFDLHPMDIYNFCMQLRRFKEKKGPRSMRYRLTPGEPVRVVFDPWGTEIVCSRSIYHGPQEEEIRVWGRRRIHILERLIPIAKRFTVHLLGRGLPSFYVADLGDMNFTLGLSGWSSNDWSTAGNFDLMAPRADVDDETKVRVFEALKAEWLATPDALAGKLGLNRDVVLGALGAYTQAGRVIYDLDKHVYRARELSRDPLPMSKLRFANEREEKATRFVDAKAAKVTNVQTTEKHTLVRGKVSHNDNRHDIELFIDADDRLFNATCTCGFFRHNRMLKGPCEHMLAIRMIHAKG